MTFLLTVVVLLFANYWCESARILGVISTPSYSHQVWLHPLWKELSVRGHQVTLVTTDPINDASLTNLTEIDTKFSYQALTDNLREIISTKSPFKTISLSLRSFSNAFDKQLGHPDVKRLIEDPTIHFDVLITEAFTLAPMAFSKKFNCPIIAVVLTEPPSRYYEMAGNPLHPIVYPNLFLAEEKDLSFKNRLLSIFYDVVYKAIINYFYIPIEEEVVEKHFGKKYNLDELRRSISLLLINSDPIFNMVRPTIPTIVHVGGRPMRLPLKPLPSDLQQALDNAKNGFIYFGLGSNANSKDLSNKTMDAILSTFKELPYTILWKYELDKLPDKPDNVITSQWIPQLEVLKHINLKLFITHGGIQSVQEGISARVPMLGIPIFVDQPFNIKKLVNRGCALSVDYKSLTKEQFKDSILELIRNPIYKNQVKKLADLAEDQPMTGLELAVWWTEYVLRHNGTSHLRSPYLDIPWYQYYLLDVAAVYLLVFVGILYFFVVVVRIIRKIFRHLVKRTMKTKND